jgi:Spy/CpxP family protein refolding chaperone
MNLIRIFLAVALVSTCGLAMMPATAGAADADASQPASAPPGPHAPQHDWKDEGHEGWDRGEGHHGWHHHHHHRHHGWRHHGWRHHGHERGEHGRGPMMMFGRLGLSDAQRESMKSIMTANRTALENMHQQSQANSLKLRQAKPDDPHYASIVASVSQANGSLLTQQITLEANTRAKIYGVLTPAQKKQLADSEAKMQEHMKEMKSHMQERDGERGEGHDEWRHGPPPGAPPANQ